MAIIEIAYPISKDGQVAALKAGRNAGVLQHIMLHSPLVDAAKGFVGATPLDSSTPMDVTIEVATPELWDLAVDLVEITPQGRATLRCGYDTSAMQSIQAYEIDTQHPNGIIPQMGIQQFNRLHTAAELLPAELLRREAIAALAAAASAASQKYWEEEREAAYQRAYDGACAFIQEYAAYGHLEAMKTLISLVSANERETLASVRMNPLEAARQAIYQAMRRD